MQSGPAKEAPLDGDEAVAAYTAARGFLVGQWIGAVMMTVSYGQLYYAVWAGTYSATAAVLGGAVLLGLGAWMYLASRRYFDRLGTAWGRRSASVATLFAGSGAVFWLLFALLVLLDWRGVPLS